MSQTTVSEGRPRPALLAGFKPGDVLDYEPKDRWCHEGVAVVDERGVAADTYWGSDPYCLNERDLATATLRFNLADFEKVAEAYKWETYAPADRQVVTSQGGHYRTLYVRVGAQPDQATKIANAREGVAEAESKLRSAEWALEYARKELAALEGEQGAAPVE